jgi:hypothetical protein
MDNLNWYHDGVAEFDLHQEVKWCRLPAVDENKTEL